MELQGDLGPISLADLFRNLSDQRATGVLSLSSPMGEKQIALSRGEIAVFSDRLTERMRLGDLLVARGRLTEEQLNEALRWQRQARPRPRLGEVLVNKRFVKKEDLQKAVRFQLEEEICDLFSWKEGHFVFDDTRAIGELDAEADAGGESAGAYVHRLSIDPQILILEAARRVDDWKIIEERLPTPYLCFRVTEKGQLRSVVQTEAAKLKNTVNLRMSLSAAAQRILLLIQEGRTLENVVKLSCQGRFKTCKMVIQFLDDGLIMPYPASELRFLASEHRMAGRFSDALNIYRRLLVISRDEGEKEGLKRLVDATAESMIRSQEGEKRLEAAGLGGHKERLQRAQRRRRVRNLALWGLLLVAFAAGGFYWIRTQREKAIWPADYLATVMETEKALSQRRYQYAAYLWRDYYAALEDKESPFAQRVKVRLDEAWKRYRSQFKYLLDQAKLIEAQGDLPKAEAAYRAMLEANPDRPFQDALRAALKELQKKKRVHANEQDLATRQKQWAKNLSEARGLERRKNFARAEQLFTATSNAAPAGSKERREAEEGLRRLKAVQERARDFYRIGLEQLKERKAQKAIENFDKARAEWPELEWARQAREKALALRARWSLLREGLRSVRAAEERGDSNEALATLKRLETDYSEFEQAQALRSRIAALAARRQGAERLWRQARAAAKAGKEEQARAFYAELLRDHRGFLRAQQIRLPARITTDPPGAVVKLNGLAQGKSPLQLKLPAAEPVTLRLELPGYAPQERVIRRLDVGDLRLFVRFKRQALRRVALSGPGLAPPVVLGGRLYVALQSALAAYDAEAGKRLWRTPELINTKATSRPHSDGSGRMLFVADPSWWYLREAPQPLNAKEFLLQTRARDVWAVSIADGSTRKLLTLPVEGVGPLLFASGTLLAGKSLLAAACADGKVRVYDPESAGKVQWEAALDSAPYPSRAPLTGILPGAHGLIVTASKSGAIRAWTLADGRKRWSLKAGARLVKASRVARTAGKKETLCAFVTAKGGAVLVDLQAGRKVWTLPPPPDQPGERIVQAALGPAGVYLLTRGGTLKALPRAAGPASGALKARWERPLDQAGPAPLFSGGALFAATRSGYVYAVDASNGRIRWRLQCGGHPTHVAASGKWVYVLTSEGQLVVLSAQ